MLYTKFKMPGAIAFCAARKDRGTYVTYNTPIKVLINGQLLKINGNDLFIEITYAGNDFIMFAPFNETTQSQRQRNKRLYDLKNKTEIVNPVTGEVLKFQRNPETSDYCELDESRFLFILLTDNYAIFRTSEEFNQYGELIFDKQTRSFIKNPCGFPGEYLFGIIEHGKKDGSGIVIVANNNAIYGWSLKQAVADGNTDALRNFRILDVPGADNSAPFPEGSYNEYLNNVPRIRTNGATQEYSMDDVQQMVREAINKILNKQL